MRKQFILITDLIAKGYGLWPYVLLVFLVLFWLYACCVLGHIPTYNNPDPKVLRLYIYISPVIKASFLTIVFSLLVIPMLIIIQLTLKPFGWRRFIISQAGYVMHFITFMAMGAWLLD